MTPTQVQDEMPRLVDPLPEQDYGPCQSPELNPQESIIAAARAIRKIDEGRICQANEELSTLLVAVSRCDAYMTHVFNNLITGCRRAFSRSYRQCSSSRPTTGFRAILLR